jgi:hypothetical protein
MIICVLAFSIALLVMNLSGYTCRSSPNACNAQDVIYYWSTYNVLGQIPGSLPHHIIWFIFSITMIVFTLALRRYSMTTYKKLNNLNVTDSDFCLFLNRLPEDVTEQ